MIELIALFFSNLKQRFNEFHLDRQLDIIYVTRRKHYYENVSD